VLLAGVARGAAGSCRATVAIEIDGLGRLETRVVAAEGAAR
jgi:hypothetical protein